MTQKIMFVSIIGIMILLSILYSLLGSRFGCFLNDSSCYYKSIMRIPIKSIILGGKEYEKEMVMKYGFLKDKVFAELKNNDGTNFYKLIYLNKVLNFEKTKDYMSQCLDNETNIDKLEQCISLYTLFEPDKNLVKTKIFKFKEDNNKRIINAHNRVLNYLDEKSGL